MAMTARQVYEAVLIEMNKVQAPSMLLEDFNYFINKAINQYINKKYNIYDINQQSTDDLRVLKATAIIPMTATSAYGTQTAGSVVSQASLFGGTYEGTLPTDYLHLLNCVCNYKVKKTFKCYDAGNYVQFGATRLTADLWSQIINNFYMKPSYKKPYYYLHNVNAQDTSVTSTYGTLSVPPTNPYATGNGLGTGTDSKNDTGSKSQDNLANVITLPTTATGTTNTTLSTGHVIDMVEKAAGVRFGNASSVRIEIRTGKDNSVFELENIYIDYVKAPQHIRLTQEEIDTTEDTSQMMEFPDYVCQEIINELTYLVMENSSDPRLNTHIPVTQSIANPAAQQLQTQQAQQA